MRRTIALWCLAALLALVALPLGQPGAQSPVRGGTLTFAAGADSDSLDPQAGGIVSPAAHQKWGKDLTLHPVGTGPFKFVEWVKGDRVVLERNDGY